MMSFVISDEFLGTFVPILVYWVYSGMYICLGSLDKYRLHSKIDEDEKNLVSKSAVVKGVLLQQTLQAIISVILFKITGSDADAATTQQFSILLLARQFIIAMLVIDTWQYFIHRYMHLNKFLYKHIHSQHHRLIVPYSYGALYNHPLEGLLLDTIGGALSFLFSVITLLTMMFTTNSMEPNTTSRSHSLLCGIGFSALTCLIHWRKEPMEDLKHGQSKYPKMSNFSFFLLGLLVNAKSSFCSLENHCNLCVLVIVHTIPIYPFFDLRAYVSV